MSAKPASRKPKKKQATDTHGSTQMLIDLGPEYNEPESGDLPEGWALPLLSDLLLYPRAQIVDGPFGSDLKASEYRESGVPIIRLQNVSRNFFDPKNLRFISQKKADELSRHEFRSRDIVVTKLGAPLGKACLVPESFGPGIIVADIVRVRVEREPVNRKYLVMAINSESVASQLAAETKGTTRPRVNLAHIRNLRIPLAPLAEQERIVAKVEVLLARVNAARDRLARVPKILKRFRQGVLAAACNGSLTLEWRAKADGSDRVAAGYRAASRVGHLTSLSDELEELPDSWEWMQFSDLIHELKNGISTRPEMTPPGVPILRISAVRSGQVDLTPERFLPSGTSLLADYSLRDGDLLFTRYNGSLDLLGVCGMVRNSSDQALIYPDKLMRVRVNETLLSAQYAELFFMSPGARKRLTGHAKSSAGQQGVSGANVKSQPIALPQLPEQREIVRRVEALFGLANAIEKRVVAATARADKLTQAILAKAFRGDLVPTEADVARQENRPYESASELLKRIRIEREQGAAGFGRTPGGRDRSKAGGRRS